MVAAFYHPQVPDSVIGSQQIDTAGSGDIQQQTEAPGPDEPSVGFVPDFSIDIIRQHAASIPVIPRFITGTPLLSDDSRKENYTGWNSGRNFLTDNGLTGVVSNSQLAQANESSPLISTTLKPASINPQQRFLSTHDWFLGIFLLLTLLFIWIRIFYSKFFSTLASALISFQISAKLFREKNVLVQRVSIVLDFIYLLVMSVFIYELVEHFEITGPGMSRFNLFLLFFNIIILYTLARNFFLRLTGHLFMVQSLFSEYIHNTFVINKGMGIVLFPIVIMAHYLPQNLVPVVLVTGMVIYMTAFIFKGIRAYQIIIRKDVLIFYLILYLCTLEILPLLLGYKVVTSLI
jgi:hypothetical protein